ncbi:hypothetical protein ACFQX6_24265 [Streptosporangium lutulentum]
MICANRGAGKTTTLAALLHGLGGRGSLLSNDRLIIHEQRRVVAIPLPVPVARGTLEAFPELLAAVPAGEADALPRRFGTRDKTALSARTFATAFGSRLVPGSALQILLVPRLTDTDHPPQARRLAPAEALQVLTEACFTPADEFWRPWLIHRTLDDAELAKAARAACARLAVSVPCFQVEYGVRGPMSRFHHVLADLIGDLL